MRSGDDGDGDDDSDDEDEAERKGPRDLFAGGEKSGLAVQDPARGAGRDNVLRDILAKARAYVLHYLSSSAHSTTNTLR